MPTYVQRVRAHFKYDPETGLLRLHRNNRVVGSIDWRHRHSYVRVLFEGKMCMAHRIAWLLTYGEPVPDIIDHIDRDPTNNKLSNLRAATRTVNGLNTSLGIRYHVNRYNKCWRMNFMNIHEYYATEEEARTRRNQLMKEAGVM